HLRRCVGVRPQEAEMVEHRMARRKSERAGDVRRLRLCLRALKMDARRCVAQLHTIEQPEEVEVPPRAAVFAVRRRHKPDRTLLPDDLFDLLVFYRSEMRRADLMSGILCPRPRDGWAAQQASH